MTTCYGSSSTNGSGGHGVGLLPISFACRLWEKFLASRSGRVTANDTLVFQEFVLSPQTSFLFGDFEVPGEILVQSFIGGWVRGNPFSDTFKRNLSQDMAIRFHNAPIVKFMIAAVTMQNSLPGLRLALEETEETETRPVPRRYGSSLSNYESITYANALDNRGASSAHDDRDHVYALLGLAPCLLKHMQVDYTLSVEEAFAAMMVSQRQQRNCSPVIKFQH